MTASPDRTAREPRVSDGTLVKYLTHWKSVGDQDRASTGLKAARDLRDARATITERDARIAELEAENARLVAESDAARNIHVLVAKLRERGNDDFVCGYLGLQITLADKLDKAEVRATAAEAKLCAAWEACREACAREADDHYAHHHGSSGTAIRRLQPPAEYAGEVTR